MTSVSQTAKGKQHPGPPLGAPAAAFVLLFGASLVTGPVLGTGSLPSPFSSPDAVQRYFAHGQTASQVNGFLQLAAAIMLTLFSAVLLSRLQFLAPNAPGPAIAGVGGVVASVFLAIAGLLQWVLGRPGMTDDPAVVRTVHYLLFLCGGPAHTAALGICVLGMAITCWFLNRLPRWVAVAGIVIAVLAVLSAATLLVPGPAVLMSIGRFAGMVWLVVVALLVPRERAARRRPAVAAGHGDVHAAAS